MSTDLEDRAAVMAEKMRTQMRVRGETLDEVMAKAGRKLPRPLRKEAKIVADASLHSSHPKLSRQIDHARVERAERNLETYLDGREPGKERLHAFLDRLAAVAFVFVVVVLGVFFTLLWRGYFTVGSG